MSAKRVLSVGQCAADHWSISRALSQAFGAQVTAADSLAEAFEQLRHEKFALVLTNRVFDADGTAALDLIKAIKDDAALAAIPVMLVSNYEDAQKQAIAAGAVPGFGKASLGQRPMLARVEPFLRD
jgi:CheY-like chemotaxis protein